MWLVSRILLVVTSLIFLLLIDNSYAQTSTADLITKETKTVVAGPQYRAGALKRFFFGTHYRRLWTTPVDASVLDLDNSAGGLAPYKRSSGFQSKSLSFKTATGGRFMFRSIDKDPATVLPEDLQKSILADIVRDQTSSAHPYGALVVPVLARAAGIFHTTPKLVVLPENGKLGEFREDFSGVVGMMEEFVIHGPENTPGFAGFDHIVSSYELTDILENSFDDYVDPREFLKARLLDILISDWDRHFDQWRWARRDQNGKHAWLPIPLDRDQAFSKFDGFLPALAENRSIVPQFEGIDKKKPDIWSLTYSGRHLDRIFLNTLTEADFREASARFMENVTDSIIEAAVKRLPPVIYDISGAELERKLKYRRDLMGEFARKYYKHLASNIKIVCRNKADYLEINRPDNEHVEVTVFQRNETSGEKEGEAVFHRIFKRKETDEIRVYLFGGNDKAVVKGSAGKSIRLRIIGGPGDDELIDESRGETYFYDLDDTKVTEGSGTVFKSGEVDSVINFHEYQPLQLSYGSLVTGLPILYFTPDDGVILGASMLISYYGFRKKPYASRMFISADYATFTSAVRSHFTGDFKKTIFGLGLRLEGVFNPREITDYYGLGNDTQRDKALEKDRFYRVQGTEYWVRPLLYQDISPKTNLFFGGSFKHFNTKTDIDESRLVIEEQPYGTNINNLLGMVAGFTADFTDNPDLPTRGASFIFGASGFPETAGNDSLFVKALGEAMFYISPLRRTTFAFRFRGEKVWGNFPYYEAAYLGGVNTMRGFARRRFGGDASLYGSLALRHELFQPVLLLPFDIGWFLIAESGRVWLNGESPGDWHWDAGGGFWFSPFFRQLSFTIALVYSEEDLRFLFGGRIAF